MTRKFDVNWGHGAKAPSPKGPSCLSYSFTDMRHEHVDFSAMASTYINSSKMAGGEEDLVIDGISEDDLEELRALGLVQKRGDKYGPTAKGSSFVEEIMRQRRARSQIKG